MDIKNTDSESQLSLRLQFWLKRLDHTLTHTQTSSNLIYLVDGAVLAFVYFAIQSLGPTRSVLFLLSFPTAVLASLNLLHARLIRIQHDWYIGIEARIVNLLNEELINRNPKCRYVASAHGVYQTIHVLIALLLATAAIAMFLYGIGHFGLLQVKV